MAKSYLCTFRDLFSLHGEVETEQVVIPIIQRDYAQGRPNPDIVRIRQRFLEALRDAVLGDGICLDFVYGDVSDKGVLTPLDGQQRLTTLFLIHWFAAKKDHVGESDYEFLRNFSYATRYSAREFCRALIGFEPDFSAKLSEQIVDEAWFPLDWNHDPTIKSMLVMIDEIARYFLDIDHLWARLVDDRKITFYFLPIKNMGLTDELYIKMNSRGKPLTRFEHFKAEFERQIEAVDKETAKRLEAKIDLQWTDFLWNYRQRNNLTDKLFLNYFKFICDIICYESGKTTQNRSYDEFFLIEEYFSAKCAGAKAHLDLLERAFDVWTDGANRALFDEFLSQSSSRPDKARLHISTTTNDLLENCLTCYTDETGARAFTFAKIILLYAFLQYALHSSAIQKEAFAERIRIVNNLVSNSDDEIGSDSETRVGGNRLPAILQQTRSIIVDGAILDSAQITCPNKNNFNLRQLEEERLKLEWRAQHPDKVPALNMLENHELLYGQIAVVGLENPDLFERFADLFRCDRDKIACALLAEGDYSRTDKNGWRRQLGSEWDFAWCSLFHKSLASGFDNTKNCLVALLSKHPSFTNDLLDEIVCDFMRECEAARRYDWRYYFVKYREFRPGRYGRYWVEGPYRFYALYTEKNVSENAYQPFLKVIDPDNIDRPALGIRIRKNGFFLFCFEDRFELQDENFNFVASLPISQQNGIDTEDRIEKYRQSPLL